MPNTLGVIDFHHLQTNPSPILQPAVQENNKRDKTPTAKRENNVPTFELAAALCKLRSVYSVVTPNLRSARCIELRFRRGEAVELEVVGILAFSEGSNLGRGWEDDQVEPFTNEMAWLGWGK